MVCFSKTKNVTLAGYTFLLTLATCIQVPLVETFKQVCWSWLELNCVGFWPSMGRIGHL